MFKFIKTSGIVACLVLVASVPVAAQVDQTLEDRQALRRQAYTAQLTQKESERLSKRCAAGQKVIANHAEKFEEIRAARGQKLDQITAKLLAISEKIKAQDVDTAALDSAIAETQSLIDEFTTKLSDHKQTMTDLAEINCAEDTQDFRAALEDVRNERKEIREASAAVKEYVRTVVKTELQNIRASLEVKNQTTDPASDEPQSSTEPSGSTDDSAAVDPDTPVSSEPGQ